MTTLEPVWKPALTSGAPFADGQPGRPHVRARTALAGRADVGASAASRCYEALVSRPGVDPALRREALERLATQDRHVDGDGAARGGRAASTATPGQRGDRRPDAAAGRHARRRIWPRSVRALEHLARTGALDTVRQGAFLALLRLDGSADAAGSLTAASARLRIDLLRAAAKRPRDRHSTACAPRCCRGSATRVATGAALAADAQPPVTGRYVRLVRPGRATGAERDRGRGLQRRRERRARRAPRPSRARSPAAPPAGTRRAPSTAASTADRRPAPIRSRARVRSRAPSRIRGGSSISAPSGRSTRSPCGPRPRGHAARALYVAVLDASRKPVFVRDGLRLHGAVYPVDIGGDLTLAAQRGGDRAAARMHGPRGRDGVAAGRRCMTQARTATGRASRRSARMPRRRAGPAAQVEPVAAEVLRYLAAIPPADRTGPAFTEAVALGRDLSRRCPTRRAGRRWRRARRAGRAHHPHRGRAAQMKFDCRAVHGAAGRGQW